MARFFIDFKGDIITTYMILLLTSIGGLATGLTVSAFVKSQEAAISLVPILLIPQVILGGLLVKLPSHKDIEIFSHLIIAKWSFEGLLTIESKKQDDTFSILVQQSIGLPTDRLGADIFVLVVYFLIMVFFTAWLLKRKDK
jgi:ABC-type transport system involved in multi-copper enzyme maturation permease subunit